MGLLNLVMRMLRPFVPHSTHVGLGADGIE